MQLPDLGKLFFFDAVFVKASFVKAATVYAFRYTKPLKAGVSSFQSIEGVDAMEKKISPICVLEDSSVAGTGRISGIEEIVSNLVPGEHLRLQRDRENYFDTWAIKIFDNKGNRLGFVTCESNEMISRLMDGGVSTYAEFKSAETRDGWVDVRMKVFVNV